MNRSIRLSTAIAIISWIVGLVLVWQIYNYLDIGDKNNSIQRRELPAAFEPIPYPDGSYSEPCDSAGCDGSQAKTIDEWNWSKK